jgi:hypothetical protein
MDFSIGWDAGMGPFVVDTAASTGRGSEICSIVAGCSVMKCWYPGALSYAMVARPP